MRRGDFSEFTDARSTIRSRRTAAPARGRAFAGNLIPAQLHQSGGARHTRRSIRCRTARAPRATTSPTSCVPYDYNAWMGRIDHNITSSTPPVRDGLLQQAPGGSLQLGAGCGERDRQRRHQRFAVTQGFDYRTNLGVNGGYTARSSQLDAARHARQLLAVRRVSAIRRRRSIRRSSGSRRPPCTLMNGYQYLPLMTFGTLQHDESELDDRVARRAALRLGRRASTGR